MRATEARSPKGRLRVYSRDILTAVRQTHWRSGGGIPFPFEVKLIRLPPRAASGPYRSHSAHWVFYQIITGREQLRTPAGTADLREGDCVRLPPGEAHPWLSTGAVDGLCHFITDNPASDAGYFPDRNKSILPGHAKPVRVQPAELYHGEE